MYRRNFFSRLKLAFGLNDYDLENINYMADWFLDNRVCNRRFRDSLHRIHDLAVEASK